MIIDFETAAGRAVCSLLDRRAAALEGRAKAGIATVETVIGGVTVTATVVAPESRRALAMAAVWRELARDLEAEIGGAA